MPGPLTVAKPVTWNGVRPKVGVSRLERSIVDARGRKPPASSAKNEGSENGRVYTATVFGRRAETDPWRVFGNGSENSPKYVWFAISPNAEYPWPRFHPTDSGSGPGGARIEPTNCTVVPEGTSIAGSIVPTIP